MSQQQELKKVINALSETESIQSLQSRLDQAGVDVDLNQIPVGKISDSFRRAMSTLLERPLGELRVEQIRAITAEVKATSIAEQTQSASSLSKPVQPSSDPTNASNPTTIQKEDGKRRRGRPPRKDAQTPNEALVTLEMIPERNELLSYFTKHYGIAHELIARYLRALEGKSFSSGDESRKFTSELNEMMHVSGLQLMDPTSRRPGYLFVSKSKACRVPGGYFRLRFTKDLDSKRAASTTYRKFPKFGLSYSPKRLERPSNISLGSDESKGGFPTTEH